MRIILFLILFVSLQSYSQNLNYARTIVNTLASPAFDGRGVVNNGAKKTAQFIEHQFDSLKMKPVKKDFAIPFQTSSVIFPEDISLSINDKQLIPGTDFLIDPASGSIEGTFQTELIRRRDLLNDPKFYNVIKTAKGKILIVDIRKKDTETKEERELIEKRINIIKYNEGAPTAGTIVYSDEKLTWGASTLISKKASFIVRTDIAPETIKSVTVQAKSKLAKCELYNVAGKIEGWRKSDSMIVLIAHYDHLGRMGSVLFPGANDNASGVAMLLDIARYYSQHQPKYTTVFVALSGEELGLEGSVAFTDKPPFDLTKIKFLINFDLAGTGDEGIKVVNATVYKERFDTLVSINKRKEYLPAVQPRGDACNSDHCLFYRKGVSCFYIYTLGGIQAYHDVLDKAETLPLTEFEDYKKLMIEFLDSI